VTREVWVFGSNLQGRHGKGAALEAVKNHGAKYGVSLGMAGNSYAIPTKNTPYEALPLSEIQGYVEDFISYAESHKNRTFIVTAIGCGLAGYKPSQIAPMFINAPDNVILPPEFSEIMAGEK